MSKEIVNKYFSDRVSTKMLSRSKYGEKYVERIVEASIPEELKEKIISSKEKKKVERKDIKLNRDIGINENMVDCVVDSLFYIEKYGSLVDVEFNSDNSRVKTNKNDYYVNLLGAYGIDKANKYIKRYKITQVNFDAFDRFHKKMPVYIIMEKEYHTEKIYENSNIKLYINLAYFHNVIYNGIREEKYNQLLYLVSVFILKSRDELMEYYKEDKEVIEMLEGMDEFFEKYGDLFKYDPVEFAKWEGEELGYDRGLEQGISRGTEQTRAEMINRMIEKGYDIDDILEITDATKAELKTINKGKNKKRPKIRTKLKSFILSLFSLG